jgi:SAM-dependent methyltransferase
MDGSRITEIVGVTEEVINRTMDRADLLAPESQPVVGEINDLVRRMYRTGVHMTSWYGTLPPNGPRARLRRFLGRGLRPELVGMENRGADYEPLPGAADDGRLPWYLYWEILWVLSRGPELRPAMRVLDGGGTSSLFSCFLASQGCDVHSVDINPDLVANGDRIAKAMRWKLSSHTMNLAAMKFPDGFFDNAYSICVFEHLDLGTKRGALSEIARCLKPGGVLSLTFDYRNPAPCLAGRGPDTNPENQLSNQADLQRCFLSTEHFEPIGNARFVDNGKSYLVHPRHGNAAYTFGAMFLRKRDR